jgi:hypothetical protein
LNRALEHAELVTDLEPPRLRVAVRQVSDLLHRLLWRFELPDGFAHSAASMVLAAELRSGKALAYLADVVEAGLVVAPGDVRLSYQAPEVAELSAGGQSTMYVGPLAADVACELVEKSRSSRVIVTDATDLVFAEGLVDVVGMRTGATVEFAVRADALGTPGSGSFELLSMRAGGSHAATTADGLDTALLTKGVLVDAQLWQSLFRNSLDVLLAVKRNPFETGRIQ